MSLTDRLGKKVAVAKVDSKMPVPSVFKPNGVVLSCTMLVVYGPDTGCD